MNLSHFVILSALLFSVGLYGVLARRNAVLILMSLELMLNAVNINLVAFAAYAHPGALLGQVFALFIITIAAAEVGLALAILIRLYRGRTSVNMDEIDLLKG